MKSSVKIAGIAAGIILAVATGAMATEGFDNPSSDSAPQIVKFGVNNFDHDGPGCGLQWDGGDSVATVKHGDDGGPGNDGCIAGQKINRLAEVYPNSRSTWDVWVNEPKADVTDFGHGPFKGWATIVGTDTAVPDTYDFVFDNTSHEGRTLYLSYEATPFK